MLLIYMLISQSSETTNYNAWDEDIAMVKVKDFNVQNYWLHTLNSFP